MKLIRAVAVCALAASALAMGCRNSEAKEGNNGRGQDMGAPMERGNTMDQGASGATPYMGGGTVVKDTSGTGGSGKPDAGTKKPKHK